MVDYDVFGEIGGMLGSKNPKFLEKPCSSAPLSTTNPIRLYSGRRNGKPVTNLLSYGTTRFFCILKKFCVK
jgi:hypothetical protein